MKRKLILIVTVVLTTLTTWSLRAGVNPHIVEVDLDIDYLAADDPTEWTPGGFVCVEGRRKITLQKVQPADWGTTAGDSTKRVRLSWGSTKIAIYDAATGGNAVISGTDYANANLPTNFWVEGVAVSATAGTSSTPGPETILAQAIPDGMYDRISFTVLFVDMEIYKPKVVHLAEPMIPDPDELSKGSVTFVNLDNDDNDSKFDYDGAGAHDDVVAGGDDELVKIKLKLQPNNLDNGQVRLTAPAGGSDIAVWTNNEKSAASAFPLTTVLSVPGDFSIEGDSLVKTLWVEGTNAQTVAQGTQLKMEYTAGGMTCHDQVALTIVGVEKVEWVGRTNSVNDTSALDADPNLTPNAVRVFPDARVNGVGGIETNARDTVDAKVTLSVAPPFEIKLYLNSFDVDDPTATNGPVDSPGTAATDVESTPDDNRGATADLGTIKELTFPAGVIVTSCLFQVSMQPGDNFRSVVNGDRDFLSTAVLENNDTVQNTGASDTEKNLNKQRIVCPAIGGASATPEQKEVRMSMPPQQKYASDTLTVWRFLNIEVDSMGSVTGNYVNGHINGFVGAAATAVTEVTTVESLDDGSLHLGPPNTGSGRFENGTIKIGASGGGTPSITITPLTGNRPHAVVFPAASIVPILFDAEEGSYWFTPDIMSGTITNITRSSAQYVLQVNPTYSSDPSIDWPNYVNGRVKCVGGNWINIAGACPGLLTVDTLDIPYYGLRDDDQITTGVDVPDPDISGIAPIWAAAYIMPRFHPTWNTPNAPFNLNSGLAGGTLGNDMTNSKAIPKSLARFWAATVKSGYQTAAAVGTHEREKVGDNDPNTEDTSRAWGSSYREVAILMEESIRDWIAADTNTPVFYRPFVPRVGWQYPVGVVFGGGGSDPDPRGDGGRQARLHEILNHELGHVFRLEHGDGQPSAAQCANGDVMSVSPERGASVFGYRSLHKLRTASKPGL
jgi:hypothetical protein